jgi:hypothetical protein
VDDAFFYHPAGTKASSDFPWVFVPRAQAHRIASATVIAHRHLLNILENQRASLGQISFSPKPIFHRGL